LHADNNGARKSTFPLKQALQFHSSSSEHVCLSLQLTIKLFQVDVCIAFSTLDFVGRSFCPRRVHAQAMNILFCLTRRTTRINSVAPRIRLILPYRAAFASSFCAGIDGC
jgi:hypothetical protein